MKKILLVTRPIAPPWDEASKNFAFDLAKKIASGKGMELHLLTNGVVADLPPEVVQEQIYTESQNDFNLGQKMKLFKFLLFNAHKFDVIHLLFTPTKANTMFMRMCLFFSRAKTIQTVATLREDMFSDDEIRKIMFADLVTTYSDHAKNKLEMLGIANAKRIYPGIDLNKYGFRKKSPELLEKFGFSADDFIIHFSGEYVRLGAMDDVIESFVRISSKLPSAKLFLAVRVKNEKDAKKKEEVVAKLKQNGLLGRTAFFDDGKYPMEDIYNLGDVSLFPVRDMKGKFDVPLVVIEAMASEKPVIISDLPILKEFAKTDNSIIIKTGDVDELAVALENIARDASRRVSIGTAARRYVEKDFDIQNVAAQYQEAYDSL